MGQPQPKNQYSEEEMRKEIIATVGLLDKSFLRVVHSMLATYVEEQIELEAKEGIVGYEADGTPVEVEAFNAQMDLIDEEVKAGETTPAKEFFKETIEWLENTK